MARAVAQLSLKEIERRYVVSGETVSAQLLSKLRRDPRAGAQRLYRTLSSRHRDAKERRARLDALLHFERVLWKAGLERVAGVDEVGVGPLAGPVVAAAVIFPPGTEIEGIDDSKALAEEERERLDAEIRARAVSVTLGVVDIEEIDRINIYHAGLAAMRQAVLKLETPPQHVLVDSRTIPDLPVPQNSFDKGDGLNFSIAAASIVAKVYRDRLMTELDERYPGYGFASHKGYATPAHQAAIRERGPCPIHRRSFDYIRELCGEYSAEYYALRKTVAEATSAAGLRRWESDLAAVEFRLSVNELKKLQLARRRSWARLS